MTKHLPSQDDIIRRDAKTMLLFERDGMIHFGLWRRWKRATSKDANKILKNFLKENEWKG
jgi:hypothetical protein